MKEKTDRRVMRTRHLLLRSLTSLMKEKSIKDITVKELCEKSNINRGTFYLHYKDIYDMLEKNEQELLAQLAQAFQNYPPRDTPDFPYPLFAELFRIIDQYSDFCFVLLSPKGDISFLTKIKQVFTHRYIQEFMTAGQTVDFLPAYYDYYSHFLVCGCCGLIETWLAQGKKESPEEMAHLMSRLISTDMRSLISEASYD